MLTSHHARLVAQKGHLRDVSLVHSGDLVADVGDRQTWSSPTTIVDQ
jgi:hypothetical protein